ncbi:ABC transporter permease [Cutibacterium sp.]|uniref:ABC transporter permease n=1 Tax=Cutibacterium sp. TaxID=1912221 RepID=UPI0026DB372D|nr:ABC transporter permease [Cutibacterium sp.]MDO4412711.1 ABC transporter permease [Cutibacterium sp.]
MSVSWTSSFNSLVRLEMFGAGLNSWRRCLSFCVSPVAYFCLLGLGLSGILGGGDYLRFVGPGIVVMQALSALSQMIYRVVIERRWGLAAMKLQSGVPMSAYVASLLVPRLIVFVIQAGVVVICMFVCGSGVSIAPLVLGVLAAVCCAVFWSLIGIVITGFVSNYQTRDFIVNIMMLPLSFSAPVFYRLDGAPLFVRILARINPLSYQVQWVRGVFNGDFLLWEFLVVLALLVAAGIFSLVAVRGLRIASFEG